MNHRKVALRFELADQRSFDVWILSTP